MQSGLVLTHISTSYLTPEEGPSGALEWGRPFKTAIVTSLLIPSLLPGLVQQGRERPIQQQEHLNDLIPVGRDNSMHAHANIYRFFFWVHRLSYTFVLWASTFHLITAWNEDLFACTPR
jgi:hypothetical protein